jgi:hypothetical protein
MTPLETLEKARCAGLTLRPHGDRLAVKPADRLTPALRAALLAHKATLLTLLSAPPCPGWQAVPPDDLPLDPIEPHPTANDREDVIAYVFRQLPPWNHKPSALRLWIERRECAYYDGPGKHWRCESFAYAAARDCANWQKKQSTGEPISPPLFQPDPPTTPPTNQAPQDTTKPHQ